MSATSLRSSSSSDGVSPHFHPPFSSPLLLRSDSGRPTARNPTLSAPDSASPRPIWCTDAPVRPRELIIRLPSFHSRFPFPGACFLSTFPSFQCCIIHSFRFLIEVAFSVLQVHFVWMLFPLMFSRFACLLEVSWRCND